MQQRPRVLHVDFIALKPELSPDARELVFVAASLLIEREGVLRVGAIEGAVAGAPFDLAVCFLLRDFEALEPFGTDGRYVRYLQKTVAPVLRAFGGADVSLDGDFPAETPALAACLAVAAPDETYDWEIRERLQAWLATASGPSTLGLAAGERERFRGVAIAFDLAPSALADDDDVLISGAWRELGRRA